MDREEFGIETVLSCSEKLFSIGVFVVLLRSFYFYYPHGGRILEGQFR